MSIPNSIINIYSSKSTLGVEMAHTMETCAIAKNTMDKDYISYELSKMFETRHIGHLMDKSSPAKKRKTS